MVLKLSEDLVATIEYKQRIGADLEFAKYNDSMAVLTDEEYKYVKHYRIYFEEQKVRKDGTLKKIKKRKLNCCMPRVRVFSKFQIFFNTLKFFSTF